MADDRVVGDDESKIITKFLLNTCLLKRPNDHHATAAAECALAVTAEYPLADNETDVIMLITGSVAEFYIQPMLSCVGDIDLMHHENNYLAIPDGHPPPSQLPAEFHSRVTVYEIIDSGFTGYVHLQLSYLLAENTDADEFVVAQYLNDPCDRPQYRYLSFDYPPETEIHGPARTGYSAVSAESGSSIDLVRCVRCLSWPTQAADWPTRHRNYGWPDPATVDRVVSNGCDVVKVVHRLCREDEQMRERQWRLSFSRAEIVLLNNWKPVQQIVYHMLRVFVKTVRLTDITDSTGTKILCNYHIKTLMMWACELKSKGWWIDNLNVVRICIELLHILADWLTNKNCHHYFINNCNLTYTALHVEIVASRLSITESWLSTWFVNNYLRKCAQLCPDSVSRLFDDVSTNMKLQNAVSAVAGWRNKTALLQLWDVCNLAELYISLGLHFHSLTALSCDYWISELTKIDSCLCRDFTAVAFLHVSRRIANKSLSDTLLDVLSTLVEQFGFKGRYSNQLGSLLLLTQATRLMKVVVNKSRSTEQLVEIELSKGYLYRALRSKDSDSDSIYCLANVYLAVLYYTTGRYQTAMDHCTQVMSSQDHSKCGSHVVQGELLPKIDNDIDSVLGLAVFYQHVRTAALNQQHTQHVSVFTTELFAHCLHVIQRRQLSQFSSTDAVQRYIKSIVHSEQMFIVDVLSLKLINMFAQKYNNPLLEHRQKLAINSPELDTSELVELLQQSAVEHLTTYRQLQAQKFGGSLVTVTIVTTDFEALYAYKRGDYQRCLQLSTQNVHTLLYNINMPDVLTYSEFVQLLDDDIVSLTAMTLIAYPSVYTRTYYRFIGIAQRTLSLYLMTQCQLKLYHSMTSLAQTLDYIEVAQRKQSIDSTLDQLTLKLTERKLMIYLTSIM